MTWSEAGRAASLAYGDGYPMSPGLAQMIVQGRDPKNESFRKAYGLGQRRCAICHQKIREKKKSPSHAPRPDYILWWNSLLKAERERIVQNAFELEN